MIASAKVFDQRISVSLQSVMKKCLLILVHLFSCVFVLAQYKVRFIVKENTFIKHDTIVLTGSFRNWDPSASPTYLMKPYGTDEKYVVLNLKGGKIWYKYTRGNWNTVEKDFNGWEVPDDTVTITKDTTLRNSVGAWRDELITDKQYTLAREKQDTNRIKILASIINIYAFTPEYYNSDSALHYAREALLLLQKLKGGKGNIDWLKTGYLTQLINIQEITAGLLNALGNYPKGLELRLDNLQLAENAPDKLVLLAATRDVIDAYAVMKDYQKVLQYSKRMQNMLIQAPPGKTNADNFQISADYNIANAYYHLHFPDSSLLYAKRVYEKIKLDNNENMQGFVSRLLGDIYAEKGETDMAFSFYKSAIPAAVRHHAFHTVAGSQMGLAKLYQKMGQKDSALFYAKLSLNTLQNNKVDIQAWGENANSYIAEIAPVIASLYQANAKPDSAYKYLLLSVNIRDSLYNLEKLREFQNLTFNETIRKQQELQAANNAKQQLETRVKILGLIISLVAALIILFILFKNNKQKQKANLLLENKKQELETTLSELKAAQGQLIQSEKMASLGELTAGIAHEIQNPLNFVNNFSEVNIELSNELKDMIRNMPINEKDKIMLEETIEHIVKNEEKINHHSKRADGIVRAMLQHSRSSTEKKFPADINALTDEYLRLSYHGMRAKDKSFNATLQTDFDESIGKIDIIQQDIGRVLLNLFTNAFFAVIDKKKEQGEAFQPVVSVTTKRVDTSLKNQDGEKGIIISIKDNGKGIPKDLKDKIFEPFFTTKPAGQGTGLGLSLSYDIIKAHGGEIKVNSTDGEGAEFIIYLPTDQ
jgi:two-component system NtrC family sensor kinase